MQKYKIAIDSCGEIFKEWNGNPSFESIPLTLNVGGEEIIDDETFDQASFLRKVAACPECPKSACPSPNRYLEAFKCEAEHVYGVTLSAELSGSYNSAQLAKDMLLEEQPGRKIHIFNSRSASIGESLIAMKVAELEEKHLPFEEIVRRVEAYIDTQNTFFVLESLETLRKNGRLSKMKAFVATALKIKPVLGSTPEGNIYQMDQARGVNKALLKMLDHISEKTPDIANRVLALSHCNCLERANMVKAAIQERLNPARIIVVDTAGVSSMYANDGGIIVVV
ncbi:MAG: DegV family protein [Blautia sp.]|nr:DegV family protein [Blautia sp.]